MGSSKRGKDRENGSEGGWEVLRRFTGRIKRERVGSKYMKEERVGGKELDWTRRGGRIG